MYFTQIMDRIFKTFQGGGHFSGGFPGGGGGAKTQKSLKGRLKTPKRPPKEHLFYALGQVPSMKPLGTAMNQQLIDILQNSNCLTWERINY